MNSGEIIGCGAALCAASAGSIVLGNTYGTLGYVLGAPAGIIILYASLYALSETEVAFKKLRSRLPTCRNGTCKSSDYAVAPNSGERDLICKCGDIYRRSGDTLFFIDPERHISPYKRRIRLCKWVLVGEENSNK